MLPEHTRITIDGPAASGKGTVAIAVARELGVPHVSSGMVFRALAYLALQEGDDVANRDESYFSSLFTTHTLSFEVLPEEVSAHLFIDGRDVTKALHSPEVTAVVPRIAAFPTVQRAAATLLKDPSSLPGIVLEGRNAGTTFMPDADVKIFLTASLDERARRRHAQYAEDGESLTFEEVRERIRLRDKQDTERAVDPLSIPEGAEVIDTTTLSVAEVVSRVCALLGYS